MPQFENADLSIEQLKTQIEAYTPDPAYSHDAWALIAVVEAIQATKEGNIGVGGQFVPYFRGDLHGEMVLLNQLEDSLKDEPSPNMRAYRFFSSQAPCPMCMLRLVTSGVGKIYHVYSDTGTQDQGDLSSLERLPPIWMELAKRQEIGEADCSPELKQISRQAFLLSVSTAAEKIQNR
jgi:tRNA(adenine34) deaminase